MARTPDRSSIATAPSDVNAAHRPARAGALTDRLTVDPALSSSTRMTTVESSVLPGETAGCDYGAQMLFEALILCPWSQQCCALSGRLDRLRQLVPHAERANTASFLEEVIHYIEELQAILGLSPQQRPPAGMAPPPQQKQVTVTKCFVWGNRSGDVGWSLPGV